MKITVEINVPEAKHHCLIDKDRQRTGFIFTEAIAKTLTEKWFGCGAFSCEIVKIQRKVK